MTFEQVKEIVVDQLGVEEEEVKLEANFKEDLDADSLDLFEIVTALEEEFDIEIPTEELQKILTVKDAVDYIEANK